MEVKINYNDPRVIGSVLEQLTANFSEDVKKRFVVGSCGGVSYDLFPDAYYTFPKKFMAVSKAGIEQATNYFNTLQEYIQTAGTLANRHGFALVLKNNEAGEFILSQEIPPTSSLYYLGIGKEEIDSSETLEQFVGMVNLVKEELDTKYNTLLGLAKQFKDI